MNRRYKEPQMNADERRYFPVTDFSKITHRKGRKERKAVQQEPLRPLRSLRLDVSLAQAHERAPPQPALTVRLRLSHTERGGINAPLTGSLSLSAGGRRSWRG